MSFPIATCFKSIVCPEYAYSVWDSHITIDINNSWSKTNIYPKINVQSDIDIATCNNDNYSEIKLANSRTSPVAIIAGLLCFTIMSCRTNSFINMMPLTTVHCMASAYIPLYSAMVIRNIIIIRWWILFLVTNNLGWTYTQIMYVFYVMCVVNLFVVLELSSLGCNQL